MESLLNMGIWKKQEPGPSICVLRLKPICITKPFGITCPKASTLFSSGLSQSPVLLIKKENEWLNAPIYLVRSSCKTLPMPFYWMACFTLPKKSEAQQQKAAGGLIVFYCQWTAEQKRQSRTLGCCLETGEGKER